MDYSSLQVRSEGSRPLGRQNEGKTQKEREIKANGIIQMKRREEKLAQKKKSRAINEAIQPSREEKLAKRNAHPQGPQDPLTHTLSLSLSFKL